MYIQKRYKSHAFGKVDSGSKGNVQTWLTSWHMSKLILNFIEVNPWSKTNRTTMETAIAGIKCQQNVTLVHFSMVLQLSSVRPLFKRVIYICRRQTMGHFLAIFVATNMIIIWPWPSIFFFFFFFWVTPNSPKACCRKIKLKTWREKTKQIMVSTCPWFVDTWSQR